MMKLYRIKDEYFDTWGDGEILNVTGDDVEMCARGWEKSIEEVMETVEEVEYVVKVYDMVTGESVYRVADGYRAAVRGIEDKLGVLKFAQRGSIWDARAASEDEDEKIHHLRVEIQRLSDFERSALMVGESFWRDRVWDLQRAETIG